jgi:DNA gyrase inhibitor GyrI
MRHRKLVDDRGEVDPSRGTAGGRPPVWRIDAAPDFDVVEREFGATRVLGMPHRGPLTLPGLAALTRKLEGTARATGVPCGGPIFTVLRSNPLETAPSRRSFLTCLPILGPVTPPEGLAVVALHGGLFVVAACPGPVRGLDKAFSFLFGRFFAARGQELARPEQPEIRLLYPVAPHEVRSEADLVTEIAVPVVITMRTDTLRNQK